MFDDVWMFLLHTSVPFLAGTVGPGPVVQQTVRQKSGSGKKQKLIGWWFCWHNLYFPTYFGYNIQIDNHIFASSGLTPRISCISFASCIEMYWILAQVPWFVQAWKIIAMCSSGNVQLLLFHKNVAWSQWTSSICDKKRWPPLDHSLGSWVMRRATGFTSFQQFDGTTIKLLLYVPDIKALGRST